MNYKTLGNTGFEISEILPGDWQIGGKWGAGGNQEQCKLSFIFPQTESINELNQVR